MFPSSLDIDYPKENLLEKDNNLHLPFTDNFYPSSPLLLDYHNNKNSEKYINYFYTNSPYSSINDEIMDKFDFIKPIEKEVKDEVEIKKENNNIKENNKEKTENKNEENEEVKFIMIDKMNELDLGKLTHITSYGCLNSTSNNDKNINKKKNLFIIKKCIKKRDPILFCKNEEIDTNNNIFKNNENICNKRYDLPSYKFSEFHITKKIKKNLKIKKKINLLKKKRKKRRIGNDKTNKELLFDNDNMKENIRYNSEVKKMTLKEKFKNLKIKIPKIINQNNILPISQQIQINSNIINYNSYKNENNEINNNFNENNINIQNNNYNNKLNNNDDYNSDLNMSKMLPSTMDLESTIKYSYIPQIFESNAPSILINGLEYTTILVPKQFIEKIKFTNI